MVNHLNQKTPPQADEIEVSIFGPGFGECIVAHVGDGKWIVVDSCLDRSKKRPVALTYFDEIGVPPSAVELILITHWHDDHVTGVDEVVDACSNAKFWCSDSLRSTEFLELLEIDLKRKGLRFTRGANSVGAVVKKIGTNFNFALASMRIYQQAISLGGKVVPVEAWALSPSQTENFLAKQKIGQLLDDSIGSETTLPDRNPNHASVVLALIIGEVDILLGADLEEAGDPNLGWSAVVSSSTRPQKFKAGLFKIRTTVP
jgi:Metallo-beta-lactamase superfamily